MVFQALPITLEQEFENAEKKFKAKMEEEQAKAVELHEEKRAGEKKFEHVGKRRKEEEKESKQQDENKGADVDEKKSEQAGRKVFGEEKERDDETGEKGKAEKEKSRKGGEEKDNIKEEKKMGEKEEVMERPGSEQGMAKTKRSTRLTKSCSVQVTGESKLCSTTKSKSGKTHTKVVKVLHGLTFS